MFVNIKNLFKVDPAILPLLLVAKQAGKEDLSMFIAMLLPDEPTIEELIKEGYIKIIKGTKNQEFPERVRIGKKGTAFLNSLEEAEVLEEDEKIFDWLSLVYKAREKEIGNKKKTKRHIASFREKSGIEKNQLAFLCKTFIDDEEQQNWSFRLEYVFFKAEGAFNTRFSLESSRLYQYYERRKSYFDERFKKI